MQRMLAPARKMIFAGYGHSHAARVDPLVSLQRDKKKPIEGHSHQVAVCCPTSGGQGIPKGTEKVDGQFEPLGESKSERRAHVEAGQGVGQ